MWRKTKGWGVNTRKAVIKWGGGMKKLKNKEGLRRIWNSRVGGWRSGTEDRPLGSLFLSV